MGTESSVSAFVRLELTDSAGWDVLLAWIRSGEAEVQESRETLLLVAAGATAPGRVHDKKQVVELLLRHDANPNHQDDHGRSALIRAAHCGDEMVVELLLQFGAEVDASGMGRSALIIAAQRGFERVVEVLLRHGADTNQQVSAQISADQASLGAGIVKGATALMLAGPPNDPQGKGKERIVDLLIQHGAKINICDSDGETALMYASRSGHERVVEGLLRLSAEIEHQDNKGATALSHAAGHGAERVVGLLLRWRAEVCRAANDGSTALMHAAGRGNEGYEGIVDMLLRHGGEIDYQNNIGETALTLATTAGHERVVDTLLRQGASTNLQTRREYTALMHAVYYGRERLVGKLCRGSDVNLQTSRGATVLHYAAWLGHVQVLDALLRGRADINHQAREDGCTALMVAAERNHPTTVRCLLRAGAAVELRDNKGMTALQLAEGQARMALEEHFAAATAEQEATRVFDELMAEIEADERAKEGMKPKKRKKGKGSGGGADVPGQPRAGQRTEGKESHVARVRCPPSTTAASDADPLNAHSLWSASGGVWAGRLSAMQRLLRAGRVRLGVLVRRLYSEFIAALRLPLGRGVGGRLDLEATGAAEPGDQALEPHCNNGEALDQPQASDLGETSDDVPATLLCAPPQLGSVSLADARFETGRPAAAPESTVGGQTTCIVCFTNPKSHSAVPCGHQCACGPCSAKMERCPYCRGTVIMWMENRLV